MVCTVCPKSCIMQVSTVPFAVEGNACPKGELFAKQEIESPKRIVTTVVKTDDKMHPLLSVRTNGSIDKKDMVKVIDAAKKIIVKTPVKLGTIIAKDIADTGVDLIATNEMNEGAKQTAR